MKQLNWPKSSKVPKRRSVRSESMSLHVISPGQPKWFVPGDNITRLLFDAGHMVLFSSAILVDKYESRLYSELAACWVEMPNLGSQYWSGMARSARVKFALKRSRKQHMQSTWVSAQAKQPNTVKKHRSTTTTHRELKICTSRPSRISSGLANTHNLHGIGGSTVVIKVREYLCAYHGKRRYKEDEEQRYKHQLLPRAPVEVSNIESKK